MLGTCIIASDGGIKGFFLLLLYTYFLQKQEKVEEGRKKKPMIETCLKGQPMKRALLLRSMYPVPSRDKGLPYRPGSVGIEGGWV